MKKIYNFNSENRKRKKTSFYPNLILVALACYCFDNIGAFLVLMFSRGKGNRLVTFHAAQSMLFYLIVYFAELVLSSFGIKIFGMFGLLSIIKILFDLLMFAKIAFPVFGIFYMITGRELRIPYLSEIAYHWV